jgi:hypothetical protein
MCSMPVTIKLIQAAWRLLHPERKQQSLRLLPSQQPTKLIQENLKKCRTRGFE